MKLHANFLESYIALEGKGHQWLQVFAVFSSCLGSLSMGALAAWTSPSIPILISNSSHAEPITLEEASYFTVIPPIAAVVASPILAMLVDGIGRQKTIILLTIFYFFSWMLVAFANNLIIFYLSRILEGFGDATLFTVVPMYIGEITQPNVRSTWGNLISLFGYLGQFFVNVIGSYCDITTTALALSCIPLLQFFLMMFMPESPYFLLIKKREHDARTALKILRWTNNIEDEFTTLSKNVQQQIAEKGTLKDLFVIPTHRKTLIIAIGIRASQQFSGFPAFFMYTQYMFNQAGSDISASTSAIIFTGVFVAVITAFSFFIGRFGRKPLMTLSCLGCGIVLAIETAYFFIHEKTALDVSNLSWIPLAGMIMYVPVCSAGLGIIPTLMLGELFATSIKGKAMGVLNICFSIFILVVVKLFHTLSVTFGMYVPFCLFSVCCFVNVAFAYYCIPETKGKTLEEIQQNLTGQRVKNKNVLTSEKHQLKF